MKKSIFLFLGITFLIGFLFGTSYISYLIASAKEGFSFWIFILSFILSTAVGALAVILVSLPFFSRDSYPFMFGIIALRTRKIHHSDLGEFYAEIYNTGTKFKPGEQKITVFHQGYLVSKELFELKYNGNMNQAKNQIKQKLDEIYKDILESKKIKKSFEVWDGYLDRQSKREDILTNKLNIK